MKIHEYQAKKLLLDYGIPAPRGGVAATPEEARRIAGELAGQVVVKAQIHAGGRGKGGRRRRRMRRRRPPGRSSKCSS